MNSSAGEGSPEERHAADGAAGTQAEAGDLAEETAAAVASLDEATATKALALASALSETLTEIARRLDEYSAFGRRSRRIGVALVVSLVLDIVLTVALGLTAVQAHDTAATGTELVRELHTAQLTVCASGNTFRADQNTIWGDFITIITTQTAGETQAQISRNSKLASQFLAYVATVNHPNDCAALYGK